MSDEGYLVPMGGYKGAGLTIAIGMLAEVINGAAFGRDVVDQPADLTTPTDTAGLGRQLDDIRSSTTRDGSSVRLPGDEAARVRHHKELNGAEMPDGLALELARLAADLGVPSPFDEQEQS